MGDDQLRGWKEIGEFLHASGRTAQRWERELRLPVHRVRTAKSAVVFANRAELLAWSQSADGDAAARERSDAGTLLECDGRLGVETNLAGAPDAASTREDSSTEADRQSSSPVGGRFQTNSLRHRISRELVLVAVVLVASILVVAALSIGHRTTPDPRASSEGTTPNTSQDRNSASAVSARTAGVVAGDMLLLRVTFADGNDARIGLVVGAIGSYTFGEHRCVALSAEPQDDAIKLHVYRVEEVGSPHGQRLSETGLLRMKLGQPARLPQPGDFKEVEWLRIKPARGRGSRQE